MGRKQIIIVCAVLCVGAILFSLARAQTGQNVPRTREGELKQRAEILLSANKPINFYAKVVDQNGSPLAGAKLSGHYRDYVRVLPIMTSDRNQNVEMTTDAKGLAQFTGVKGELLCVEGVSKSGYLLSPKAPMSGTYTEVDPTKPIVFRMWKSQGADRLMKVNERAGIPFDGTPQYFDLRVGRAVRDLPADLKVTVERTPLEPKNGSKERYDWVARVEVPEGGLIQTDDEFMFMAPENGYSRELSIQVKATDSNWVPRKTVQFYILSRGGYGRGEVEFITYPQGAKAIMTYKTYFNPSGSRNLEYDVRQDTSKNNHFPPPQ